MRVRLIIPLLVLVFAVAAPLAAQDQRPQKVWRIGLLGDDAINSGFYDRFKEGIGYAEGQQVVFIERHADSKPSQLPSAIAALIQARPDVILARGPAAVAAARRSTTTIPIVAIDLESDPLALGYAKTLARPGGNVTGVFLDMPDLSAKQLQLFREIVPSLSRV